MTEADLLDARALRYAVNRAATAVAAHRFADDSDIEVINALARQSPPRPQWIEDRAVEVAEDGVRAAIASVAADGVAILSEAKASRVRSCPECQMMFVDRSRSGKRP